MTKRSFQLPKRTGRVRLCLLLLALCTSCFRQSSSALLFANGYAPPAVVIGRQRSNHQTSYPPTLGSSHLYSHPPTGSRIVPDSGRPFLERRHHHCNRMLLHSTTAAAEDDGAVKEEQPKEKSQLSRPERKALERERKKRRQKGIHIKPPQPDVELSSTTTADEVTRAIKKAQKHHDNGQLQQIGDFIMDSCDVGFAYGYRGSLLARLAVAALHCNSPMVARRAIDMRRLEYRPSMLPMESAAIIRGLLRIQNVTDAWEALHDELSLPLEGTDMDLENNRDKLKHRALSLGSIASRYFFNKDPVMAVKACRMLADLGPVVRQAHLGPKELEMPWLRIMKGAAICETCRRNGTTVMTVGEGADDGVVERKVELPCNVLYSVLNAMTTFPSDNNDQVFEAMSNALVRRVVFLTGAVDMKGCPPADRGEAVFIGRSNVGKSSLVNMVTNRKALAFTSKRPGKTQQFNFFAVNDKPGREREIRFGDVLKGEKDGDSFNIVDLPGFGFAKVPQAQRDSWTAFMAEYLSTRRTLRVVFHLIDGRHGPIDEDAAVMKQVGESLPKNVQYVVILTKADKNVKGNLKKRPGKVSVDIINSVREAMNENKVGNAPIIVTSAESKLGRDDIWRYLRLAAEA